MKRLHLFLRLFLTLLAVLNMAFLVKGQARVVLQEQYYFGDNPGNLQLFTYKSDSAKRHKQPIVILLHGCNQNARDAVEISGWDKLARENDLLILAPQQKFGNNASLCFSWFQKADTDRGFGEVASIEAMRRYAVKNLNGDSTDVHVVGFSAGAAMAVAYGVSYSDKVKSVSSFAGAPFQIALTPKEGLKGMLGNLQVSEAELKRRLLLAKQGPLPYLLIFQGLKDKVVVPQNAFLMLEQWKGGYAGELKKDSCTSFAPLSPVKCTCFTENTNERIRFYTVEDLGHKLLVDPGEAPHQGGRVGLFSVDRDFHASFEVLLRVGLLLSNE